MAFFNGLNIVENIMRIFEPKNEFGLSLISSGEMVANTITIKADVNNGKLIITDTEIEGGGGKPSEVNKWTV